MSFTWTSCCSCQVRREMEVPGTCTVRRAVTYPVFTGLCSCHMETEVDISDYSAVRTALDVDLVLLKIFSYLDFQTLKSCRLVRISWKSCANFELRLRDCTRTFVTPKNLPQMLATVQKTKSNTFASFPSGDFVLERIGNSRSFWSNLHRLFAHFCPANGGAGQKTRVKSLTVIWPTSPRDDGPSSCVIKHFLQILALVSHSLESLQVTHYLMAYDLDQTDQTKKLMVDLNLQLAALKSINILPRYGSDAQFHHKRRSLSSRSLGLKVIQSSPNLEKVDNLYPENPCQWPRYVHLIKNYAYHRPFSLDNNFVALDSFTRATKGKRVALESLSDSCYLFPYRSEGQGPEGWEGQPLDLRQEEAMPLFLRILQNCHNSLRELRLLDFPTFNFSSPSLPPLHNLQRLQVKIACGRNIDHFFNPDENRMNVNSKVSVNVLPNLKTVSLVLFWGWENWMMPDTNFVPRIAYKSVTNLEISPEFRENGSLLGGGGGESDFPEKWLDALHKFFPNIENVTILNALPLYHLHSFLGPGSKFNLRSMTFNVHLGVYKEYSNLDPLLRELTATTEAIHGLMGLRKLDVIFEDYLYTSKDLIAPLISPEALQLFLRPLSDLRITFHYDHNQSHKELLSWLRPLAYASSRVDFKHLGREPFARSLEEALWVTPTESRRDPMLIRLLGCVAFLCLCPTCIVLAYTLA